MKDWVRYWSLSEVETFVPISEHPLEEVRLRTSQNPLEIWAHKYPEFEPVRVRSQVARKGSRKGARHRDKSLFSVEISFIPPAG